MNNVLSRVSGGDERYPKRKHPRLDLPLYGEVGQVCSVTAVVKERIPVFADYAVAQAAVDMLEDRAEATGVLVYAYCIMPDHVHLLLQPSESCDIVTFVGQYKNLVLKAAWRHGIQGSFWQRSFWDHFLRREECLNEVAEYILTNPVRKRLAADWRDYPFSGSFVYDIR